MRAKSNAGNEIRTRTPCEAADPKSATPPTSDRLPLSARSTAYHRVAPDSSGCVTSHVTRSRVKRRRVFCWRCTRRFTVRGVAKYCPPCRAALRKPNSYAAPQRKWPASFLTVEGAA